MEQIAQHKKLISQIPAHIFRRNKEFIQNVIKMLLGNITAQMIALAGVPIITRLYTPEDYGAMTLVTSYVTVLAVAFSLQYQSAIVIEDSEKNANHLLILCVTLSLIFLIIIAICQFLFGEQVVIWIDFPYNKNLLWFIPVNAFAVNLLQVSSSLGTRYKLFGWLSVANAGNNLSSVLFKIVLGVLAGSSVFWLVLGNFLGPMIASVILVFILLRGNLKTIITCFSLQRLRHVAFKHREFPKFSLWNGILDRFSKGLPIILLAYYFDSITVGYYGLAYFVLQRPVNLMGLSLSKVFLQKAAEANSKKKNLRSQWAKATLGLAAIGFVPFALLMCYGEYLFLLIFGENWELAGVYAQILSLWTYLLFIVIPSTQLIIIKKALKFNLFYNVSNTISKIVVIIVVSIISADAIITISFLVFISSIFNLFYLGNAYRLSGR